MKKPFPKTSNPKLEKREEQVHKDLDHDGEKGEPKAHQMKVLGTTRKKPKK